MKKKKKHWLLVQTKYKRSCIFIVWFLHLPQRLHPMDAAFQLSSLIAFSSQVVSVFHTIHLSLMFDLCQSCCMWTTESRTMKPQKMLHSSMVPQGWWPLQCFLYSLTSIYLSSVDSVYFFTAWYCELGITGCFYFFHASLFPLKLLRCVRTWIFNGLFIFGCI